MNLFKPIKWICLQLFHVAALTDWQGIKHLKSSGSKFVHWHFSYPNLRKVGLCGIFSKSADPPYIWEFCCILATELFCIAQPVWYRYVGLSQPPGPIWHDCDVASTVNGWKHTFLDQPQYMQSIEVDAECFGHVCSRDVLLAKEEWECGKKDGKNEVDPRLTVHNVQQLEPGRKSQLGRNKLCRGE